MEKTETEKAQARFDQLLKALGRMSEKDWQAYLNNL